MLKFLSGAVTQGSADAFATASIATGLANLSAGYRIRGITYDLPNPVEVDSNLQVQLVRRLPTALINLADRRLIDYYNRVTLITTSGIIQLGTVVEKWFPKDLELLIVEDPIYFSIDSATTSLSNVATVKVYYEDVRLSETAKLSQLAESLNA